jgi:outer membrane protein assembly factor BamE (lipoprotein component of BamABCDE complex)
MRNTTVILSILFLIAGLIGCTSTSHTGIDFDASKITKIEKEKTTADELVQMFGEPFMKTVISENGAKWVYNYITRKSKGVFSVTTATSQKILEIKLQDNIVVNYRYTAGKVPVEVKTQ